LPHSDGRRIDPPCRSAPLRYRPDQIALSS
jgi:hypothetical protein